MVSIIYAVLGRDARWWSTHYPVLVWITHEYFCCNLCLFDQVPLAPDVDFTALARASPGMSGADLENVVNTAALRAAKEKRSNVIMDDFVEAQDRVWTHF
jgi:SpoVK/Ycf46/Vps4 family AAA+-type ATPase